MPTDKILKAAQTILKKEIEALRDSSRALDENFVRAVRLIRKSKGKVVVTGIGKSGLIGQKIAATMTSTGTLAVYMHATDAIHGDLGMVTDQDVVLAITNSGQTDERLALIAPLRQIGAKIIAMVGRTESRLAREADCVLRIEVDSEADHLNLAPTSSALVTLGLGDALAGTLSELRGFKPADYAKFHPGGALGRQLLMTVKDLMHSGKQHPMVTANAAIDEVLEELTSKRLGGVNVVENRRSCKLLGIITDGDLKHSLKLREKFFDLKASDLMTSDPTFVYVEDKAERALELMENRPFQITVLPVVSNKSKKTIGMLRLHDLLQVYG